MYLMRGQVPDFGNAGAKRKADHFDRLPLGLDLREIEDLVDDRQEMRGARLDVA
jgi:hypothetical protein